MSSLVRPIFHCLLVVLISLLAAGCSPEAKRKKLSESADRHYLAGEYDRAELEYLSLVKDDPQNGKAFGRLGLIYAAQGRNSRAIAFIMRGHEMQPDDLELRIMAGKLYLLSGKIAEARAEANLVLDRNPQDAEAPSLLVATIQKPEDVELVRRRLSELPSPAPVRAPVLAALAALEMKVGHVAEAESLLQKAKAADPTFVAAYSTEGAIQVSKRNLPEADKAFKQAAELSAPRSPQRLQYVQFKIRTGQLPDAIKLLEEMTVKTPDYLPAWLALAEINLGKNELTEAKRQIDRVAHRDPQSLEAMMLQGRLHSLNNQPEKAIELFEKLTTSYPKLTELHLELGRAYALSGELTKAIGSLNQALALNPGHTDTALLLAQLHMRRGDYNAAIALLRRLLEQRPNLAPARVMLADAYRSQGSMPEALQLYRQLAQQFPDNPQPSMAIGIILAQQGKNADAQAAFEQAFKLTPDSPAALEQIVNLGIRNRQYASVTTRVETEVAANPKLAGPGQLLLAKIKLAQEDQTAAEAHLKKAIELMPDSPSPYLLLAGVYSRANREDEALRQLNEVLTRDPKQITALMLVSVIHDQRGNLAEARAGYEKLLAVNPRSMVALNNLAYLEAEKFNDLEKAYALAQKARQFAPGDPHTADTLGWILHRRRQYARARGLLEESLEKLSGEGEIHFHLGLTCYMMGDEAAARTSLTRSLQLSPSAAWANTARQALTVLDLVPERLDASAKPIIAKALADRPDDPVALYRQAVLLEKEGQIEPAILAIEEAIKANDQNATLLTVLARLHGRAKNPAKALEYAKAARRLSPDDPEVARSLARLAYDNGDYPWAASLLQEAVRRRQDSPELYFELALASYSVGRLSETQDALRKTLELSGKQLFTRAEEARRMLEQINLAANPAEAVRQASLIEKNLQADPDSVPTLMAAAVVSEQRADLAAARRTYEKILTRFPDFSPAKHRLVVLGADLQVPDNKLYDWALQIRPAYPNDPIVAKALGIQSFLKGESARAAALLKESVLARTNDALSHYYLGLAQQKTKDAAFRASLQRALDLGLSDATAVEQARKLLTPEK